jgi:hypothetical protein
MTLRGTRVQGSRFKGSGFKEGNQSLTLERVIPPGWETFETLGFSPAAGLKSGQFDRERNFLVSEKNSKSQITTIGSRVQRFRVLGSTLNERSHSFNPERGTENL